MSLQNVLMICLKFFSNCLCNLRDIIRGDQVVFTIIYDRDRDVFEGIPGYNSIIPIEISSPSAVFNLVVSEDNAGRLYLWVSNIGRRVRVEPKCRGIWVVPITNSDYIVVLDNYIDVRCIVTDMNSNRGRATHSGSQVDVVVSDSNVLERLTFYTIVTHTRYVVIFDNSICTPATIT